MKRIATFKASLDDAINFQAIPPYHTNLYIDFVHYFRKFAKALHMLCKLVLKTSRLEEQEERKFERIYEALGDREIIENHRTELLKTIHQLESDIGI